MTMRMTIGDVTYTLDYNRATRLLIISRDNWSVVYPGSYYAAIVQTAAAQHPDLVPDLYRLWLRRYGHAGVHALDGDRRVSICAAEFGWLTFDLSACRVTWTNAPLRAVIAAQLHPAVVDALAYDDLPAVYAGFAVCLVRADDAVHALTINPHRPPDPARIEPSALRDLVRDVFAQA